MTSDEQLIGEIQQGSRAAFETLFERYRQPVWQFFRRRTRRADVAEELSQDTFVAVLEGAGRYKQRGMFRSYLFGIAYNVLLADRRKAAHRATDPLHVEPADQEPFDPDRASGSATHSPGSTRTTRILMLLEYEQLSPGNRGPARDAVEHGQSHLFRALGAEISAGDTGTASSEDDHGGR